MRVKLQQSASTRIRNIAEEGTEGANEEQQGCESTHDKNITIRIQRHIPTTESIIYGEKLWGIYIRYTTKATPYLDNYNEYRDDIMRLETLIYRINGVSADRHRDAIPSQEQERLERPRIII